MFLSPNNPGKIISMCLGRKMMSSVYLTEVFEGIQVPVSHRQIDLGFWKSKEFLLRDIWAKE